MESEIPFSQVVPLARETNIVGKQKEVDRGMR